MYCIVCISTACVLYILNYCSLVRRLLYMSVLRMGAVLGLGKLMSDQETTNLVCNLRTGGHTTGAHEWMEYMCEVHAQ